MQIMATNAPPSHSHWLALLGQKLHIGPHLSRMVLFICFLLKSTFKNK